jgi:hypothetical protein
MLVSLMPLPLRDRTFVPPEERRVGPTVSSARRRRLYRFPCVMCVVANRFAVNVVIFVCWTTMLPSRPSVLFFFLFFFFVRPIQSQSRSVLWALVVSMAVGTLIRSVMLRSTTLAIKDKKQK